MKHRTFCVSFFFFNDTATTEIYTLSLHDALPISCRRSKAGPERQTLDANLKVGRKAPWKPVAAISRSSRSSVSAADRKSTLLNSSHANISYAVFCLKKKKNHQLCQTNFM